MCSRGLSLRFSRRSIGACGSISIDTHCLAASTDRELKIRFSNSIRFDLGKLCNLNPVLPRQCCIYAAASAVAAQTAGYAIARGAEVHRTDGGDVAAHDGGMSACTRARSF